MKKNRLIYIILILSLIYIAGIVLHTPYFIGPPDSTQWRYLNRGTPTNITIAAIVGLSIILTYHFFTKKKEISKKDEVIFIIIIFLLNIFFLLAVINITEGGLTNIYGIIHSPHASGYFTEASRLKYPSQFLYNYSGKMHLLEQHVQTHPPGAVLSAWEVNNFLLGKNSFNHFIAEKFMKDNEHIDLGLLNERKRTGLLILSVIITLIIAIIPLIVYLITRFLFDTNKAMLASVLWLLIPAPLLFYPSLDVIYALLSSLIIYFFYRLMFSKRIIWPLLVGIILSIALFFTFAFLFFIPFIILVYLFMLYRKKTTLLRIVKNISIILAPLLLFYAFLFISYNFNIIQTFISSNAGFPENIRNTVLGNPTQRHYIPWVFFNLLEFIAFMGIPIIIFLIIKITKSIKLSNTKHWVFLAYIASILLLNFSGITLAEVARLWIFLMPLLVIFAAEKLSELKNRKLIYLIMLLQLVIIIIQKINLRLIDI